MAELITRSLRWFLNALPGNCCVMEKTNSTLVYITEASLPLYGFKDLNDSEGRELEEIRSPLANYAPIHRQQNNEVMAAGTTREYFDTHYYADNRWYCFHGRKRVFHSDDENEALHNRPYTDDDIAGVIYHGTDITAPATIELARYLASYSGAASNQVSYEIGTAPQALPLTETQQRLIFWQLRDTPNQQIAQHLGCNRYQLEDQRQQLWQYLGVSNHDDCVSKAIALGYQQMLPRSIFMEYCGPSQGPGGNTMRSWFGQGKAS